MGHSLISHTHFPPSNGKDWHGETENQRERVSNRGIDRDNLKDRQRDRAGQRQRQIESQRERNKERKIDKTQVFNFYNFKPSTSIWDNGEYFLDT